MQVCLTLKGWNLPNQVENAAKNVRHEKQLQKQAHQQVARFGLPVDLNALFYI